MDEEKNKDPIDELNEGLYSPEAPEVNKILKRGINREEEKEKSFEVNRQWGEQKITGRLEKVWGWSKREQPIFQKILWFALAFFVLSFGVAAFIYLRGINTVSAEKLDVNLVAPLSVSASNPFAIDIGITNKNSEDVSDVEILVDYPEGSRTVEDNTRPIVEDLIKVGLIKKDQLVKKRSEAILFGEEGEKKHINITLHYKVPGSTSVFEKKTSYDVAISTAPVTVSVDAVKELNSNQEITFNVKVTSNSATVLRNIAVQPSYPFGFTYIASNPPFSSTIINAPPIWVINELAPAESKEFQLVGRLKGEKDEEKYFKFQIGSVDPLNPTHIVTQYVTVDRLVAIHLPFISSEIKFGDIGNDKTTVKAGDTVRGAIAFKNNLGTSITDLELTLKLKDNNLIDRSHILATNGFYSSLDNTIIWNKQTRSNFEKIDAGVGDQVTFNLPFIRPSVGALNSTSLKNLMAEFDLTIKGKRLSDENVPEEIVLLDSKAVKVGTEAIIKPQILYTVGPFTNSGGLPPRVNRPTSYTVIFSLSDTLNDIQNGVMTATLPPYITFEGSVSPLTQRVTFNKNNNQVRWEVGTLFSGQGYRTPVREVAFKIILTPSANQIDSIPSMVTKISFEGVDAFTGETVTDSTFDLTTELKLDPGFHYGQDKISQ